MTSAQPPRRVRLARCWITRRLRQEIGRLAESHLKTLLVRRPKATLIDYGCGRMPYRDLLTPLVFRYIGADIGDSGAELVIDPQTGRVPVQDGTADVVLSTQVLEHVSEPGAYLKEAKRLLAQDGHLFLTTHGLWQSHPHPVDYWRWTEAGLCRLLEQNGWRILNTTRVGGSVVAALCLLQDGLMQAFPRLTKWWLPAVIQPAIGLADSLLAHRRESSDACVYIVVASPV